MQTLTYVLSQALGRTVIDETGLKGAFDMTLRWTPDPGIGLGSTDAPPSLFTAVQEQMGLKLQAGKGMTEMIVIDNLNDRVKIEGYGSATSPMASRSQSLRRDFLARLSIGTTSYMTVQFPRV